MKDVLIFNFFILFVILSKNYEHDLFKTIKLMIDLEKNILFYFNKFYSLKFLSKLE